ncbi:zinc-ribbon domain containing protein [Nitzschia inconspicua]|uniref:Zinc-ribbon domain containing protein n=1 Tax=Nitzschia inconspicua TaxID=303405 RepID=A0A9K3PZF2_9STRA|nr:zinc-ribbon domain containing protein [Nitzschia inconspicua]
MGDAMDVDQDNGTVERDQQNRQQNPMYHYQHETANLRDENTSYRTSRRGSMSHEEERQRRASIKAILADNSITPQERRRSIQNLMDGRRSSIGTASVASSAGNTDENSNPYGYGDTGMYGDGDSSPYGYGDAGPTPRGDYQQGSHDIGYGEGFSSVEGDYCMPVCNENTKRAEMTRPPCSHYERKCTLVSHCCGAAFGCRICHDDSPILPPLLIAKQAARRYARSSSLPGGYTSMDPQTPEDTHHTIDRFKIREVICRECYTKQSSKTNNCVNCGVQFGEYHCIICNLWMANDEKPYHCNDCGFCRVGGAENFQHCHDCGMCIDKRLYSNHNCKSGKYKSNCPVCQEFLFSSRSASHEMPCGHAIHWECFRQLAAHDSRCPVCKKTAETRERMMPTWNAMAAGVALQSVPPELARVVNITCNDCEETEDARAWHFLGVQCRNCSSFNTVVDRIIMSGEEAHEFLEALQTRSDLTEGNEEGTQRISRRRINRRRSLF